METRIRSFLSRKSASRSQSNLRVNGQAYECIPPGEPPVKGSYPVSGNGPDILEELHRASTRRNTAGRRSTDAAAPPPIIAQGRRASNDPRPSTAPQSGPRAGRIRSGFPTKLPATFLRKALEAPVVPPQAAEQRVVQAQAYEADPKCGNFHERAESRASRSGSSYVDLFEAASTINPAENTPGRRVVASGARIFGEDVADRNIADFGGVDFDSSEYAYLKEIYGLKSSVRSSRVPSTVGGTVGLGSINGRSHKRDGRVILDGDGSDDGAMSPPTAQQSSQPKSRLSSMLKLPQSHASPQVQIRRSRSKLNQMENHMGLTPHPSCPTQPDDSIIHARPLSPPNFPPSSRNSSVSSARGHDDVKYFHHRNCIDRRDRSLHSHPPVDLVSKVAPALYLSPSDEPGIESLPLQNGSVTSTKPRIASQVEDGTSDSGEPTRGRSIKSLLFVPKITISPTRGVDSPTIGRFPVAVRQSSKHKEKEAVLYEPMPLPPKTNNTTITQPVSLPTPPISPTDTEETHVVIPPQDASLERPIPSATRSRDNLANYSVFPSPSRNRASHASSTQPEHKEQNGSSNKSSRAVIEGVKITPSVDTKDTIKKMPAITHEYISPRVHYDTREVITQEVHTYEIVHRVLPIIDVEVLPTMHYIQDPEQPSSLKEVPISAVAPKNNNWSISPSGGPPLSSKKSSTMPGGHGFSEYSWRHEPVSEPVTHSYRSGNNTESLHVNNIGPSSWRHDNGSFSSFDEEERRPAKGEEELLFKESGYGAFGFLPGLADLSPTAPVFGSNLHRNGARPVSMFASFPANSKDRRRSSMRESDLDTGDEETMRSLRELRGIRELRELRETREIREFRESRELRGTRELRPHKSHVKFAKSRNNAPEVDYVDVPRDSARCITRGAGSRSNEYLRGMSLVTSTMGRLNVR